MRVLRVIKQTANGIEDTANGAGPYGPAPGWAPPLEGEGHQDNRTGVGGPRHHRQYVIATAHPVPRQLRTGEPANAITFVPGRHLENIKMMANKNGDQPAPAFNTYRGMLR